MFITCPLRLCFEMEPNPISAASRSRPEAGPAGAASPWPRPSLSTPGKTLVLKRTWDDAGTRSRWCLELVKRPGGREVRVGRQTCWGPGGGLQPTRGHVGRVGGGPGGSLLPALLATSPRPPQQHALQCPMVFFALGTGSQYQTGVWGAGSGPRALTGWGSLGPWRSGVSLWPQTGFP